jgi:hypothetical protein
MNKFIKAALVFFIYMLWTTSYAGSFFIKMELIGDAPVHVTATSKKILGMATKDYDFTLDSTHPSHETTALAASGAEIFDSVIYYTFNNNDTLRIICPGDGHPCECNDERRGAIYSVVCEGNHGMMHVHVLLN